MMRVESLDSLPGNEQITADLCLIGSGPASLTIAAELRQENIRLLIIESGGLEWQAHAEALSEIESVGAPRVMEQTKVRNRILGGSSHTWAGRCAVFDPIDLESRAWVPLSGWPLTPDQLVPFIGRACSHLDVPPYQQGNAIWPELEAHRSTNETGEGGLSPFFWGFSRDDKNPLDFLRFGPRFLRRGPDNCRVIHHATVTHIDTTPDGSAVQGIEIADQTNRRFQVTAPLVVLGAGGIENPRLLLASRRVVPCGVGNERDLVGRYLMDHPRTRLAQFEVRDKAVRKVQDRYGLYRLKAGGMVLRGLALSEKVQREEGLLNCAAWLTENRSAQDPWDALKRVVKPGPEGRKPADLLAVLRHPGILLEGSRRRLLEGHGVMHLLDNLFLDAMVEQTPNADSRLTLAEREDRFGMPLPRIDWRIGDQERRSIARLAGLIVEEFARLGLPAPQPAAWIQENDHAAAEFYDPAHPSGTTRMADDPARGVVDANAQVHGVRGLYVAGGSVFPTNGHVNPTMMIVVLAIRLADQLRARLAQPAATAAPGAQESVKVENQASYV